MLLSSSKSNPGMPSIRSRVLRCNMEWIRGGRIRRGKERGGAYASGFFQIYEQSRNTSSDFVDETGERLNHQRRPHYDQQIAHWEVLKRIPLIGDTVMTSIFNISDSSHTIMAQVKNFRGKASPKKTMSKTRNPYSTIVQ